MRVTGMSMAMLIFTASASPPATHLTLNEALQKADTSHPAIKAAEQAVVSAEGSLLQARLKPNPNLNFQTENWRFNGDPSFRPSQDLDTFLYVTQPIETGGKRSRRMEGARKDISAAQAETELLRWRIRQEIRLAFQRALLEQEQMTLMKSAGRDLDQIVDYHKIRVEQGATAEADLIKVILERERQRLAESAAEAEAERSLLAVLQAMGERAPYPSYQLVDIQEAVRENPLSESELRRRAIEKRSDLRLARLQVERAQAALEMERALKKPDVDVIMGYKRTGGYNTLLAGMTVPLPLFNRNEGRIAQGLSELQHAEFLLQAAQTRAEAEISSAIAGVRRKLAMTHQMETGIVERAQESWRISLAAYQEGGTDLLYLLDAQRLLKEVQLMQARLRMEYRLSVMELESAIGIENVSLAEDMPRANP